ncbi:MAG: sodium:calcium antiporter [Gammaproteobacteria bacterium]|nr:sodium:calcium antiporter [Gammaproteobacteria bacterium]
MELFALLAGLAGLWLGTELTIHGAVAVAQRLGVPEFIVGLTVLSIGSDLPELAIAVDAAIWNLLAREASDVVVGSALGSCLGQIGLVLGITGLIGFLKLPKKVVYQQGSMLLGSLVLLSVFGLDGQVTRVEGIVLVALYVSYLLLILVDVITLGHGGKEASDSSLVVSLGFLLIGLVIVVGSAELTVSSAVSVANKFNVEQSFVAIVIIGLGSSLPELSISLGAMLKRRATLSVGNLIGSNVFDTLVPVGVAAAIAGLEFNADMWRQEVPFLFVLTSVVLFFFIRKIGIQRFEAIIILSMYVAYVTTKFLGAFQ